MGLQLIFGLTAFALFWITLEASQQNIASAFAEGIVDIVSSDGEITGEVVLERIQATRESEFVKLMVLSVLIALVFGYFVSRATLLPARDALTAQKRFISNVAHELRTPLSIIKTNAEVLLLDPQVRPTTRSVMTETVEEVDRASDIINNLLSLDTYLQPHALEFGVVDMGDVAEAAVRSVQQLVQNRELTINVERRGDYLSVRGNRTALEQVALNLLRNAITHTPAGGHITVRVEPDYQGFIILAVQDTGSGIARRDLFHIFEPYYRAETSRVRAKGGSGLGLTIVNEIVKSHGGKISVRTKLDHGTTFSIRLPCIEPQQLAMDGVEKRDADGATDEMVLDFSRRS